VVFAGFALYVWWRMVADDYRRTLEDDEDEPDDEFPSDDLPASTKPEQVKP
jgi:hypothetical protein